MKYIYLCAILTMVSCSEALDPSLMVNCVKTDTGSTCSENGNAALMIPEKDLPSIKALALKGSGEAALKLGNYFIFVRNEISEGEYWINISAEDGYPPGMYALGNFLKNQVHLNKDNRTHDPALRARFWLERAKEAGYEPASDLLPTIEAQ